MTADRPSSYDDDRSVPIAERRAANADEIGDTDSFGAQWGLMRMLANPTPEGIAETINRLSDDQLDDVTFFLDNLPPDEEVAVNRAIGLAT